MTDFIYKKLNDYWKILDISITISTILNPSSKLLTFSFRTQHDTVSTLRVSLDPMSAFSVLDYRFEIYLVLYGSL